MKAKCPKCGKKLRVSPQLAGKRVKCPGCGHVLVLRSPTTRVPEAADLCDAPSGTTPPVPAPAEPQDAAIKANLLRTGYTRFEVHHFPMAQFPMPSICTSCATSLEPATAAQSEECSPSQVFGGGILDMQETTYTLSQKAYLCRRCAASGRAVGEFIHFGLTREDPPVVIIEVGSDAAAEVWRREIARYREQTFELLAKDGDEGMKELVDKLVAVQEKRVDEGKVCCKKCGAELLLKAAEESNRLCSRCQKEAQAQCFVATACCGSPDAPPVLALRCFRDRVLMRSRAGRFMIAVYYRLSPPVARWLLHRPTLRAYTRRCVIDPIGALVTRLCLRDSPTNSSSRRERSRR